MVNTNLVLQMYDITDARSYYPPMRPERLAVYVYSNTAKLQLFLGAITVTTPFLSLPIVV
jgi:hypothetical protein